MCSTHDRLPAGRDSRRRMMPLALLAATVGGALAGSLGGCAQPRQQAHTPPPMLIDGAMQLRDWERSVAYYPNGDTQSGYNRFPIRSDAQVGESEYTDAAYDIGASLVQTVALPFTYFFIPPFAPAVYTGEQIGPTYTAMPPMRPADPTVRVDDLVVDRDTLEVVGTPRETRETRSRQHGPMGPNDTEFMPSAPTPAREWE